MKGYTKITIEDQDECGSFPIKEVWTFERNNSFETIEEWVDLFNKILQIRGFHNSMRVGITEEYIDG